MNKNPNQAMDPLRAEFIKYVFSKQGQEVVLKDGYYPVTKPIADEDLDSLGIK
jgi:phosphate transport system substrate-binding protein